MKKALVIGLLLFAVVMLLNFGFSIHTRLKMFKYENGSALIKKTIPKPVVVLEQKSGTQVYAEANKKLSLAEGQKRVVFIGDSLTFRWNLERHFAGWPIQMVNRGVGSEVTEEILTRFISDVVLLKPTAVVILGGTNDATDLKYSTAAATRNLKNMVDIAKRNNIRVFLATLPPITLLQQLSADRESRRYIKRLNDLNAWIKRQRRPGVIILDFHTALKDEQGYLKLGYRYDDLHIHDEGYIVMTQVVQDAFQKNLR